MESLNDSLTSIGGSDISSSGTIKIITGKGICGFDSIKSIFTSDYIQPKVKAVYPNEKKRTVTVKFADGSVITSKCHEEDTFDITAGVAICIASYVCGGKKQFHTLVERRLKNSK